MNTKHKSLYVGLVVLFLFVWAGAFGFLVKQLNSTYPILETYELWYYFCKIIGVGVPIAVVLYISNKDKTTHE